MAIIQRNELKKMSIEQLQEKKVELQKEMVKINAQLSTKTTPENPGRIKAIKKTIARIYTQVGEIKRQAPKPAQKKQVKEVKKTKHE
jgi:large subunit ribosomal protein L29